MYDTDIQCTFLFQELVSQFQNATKEGILHLDHTLLICTIFNYSLLVVDKFCTKFLSNRDSSCLHHN